MRSAFWGIAHLAAALAFTGIPLPGLASGTTNLPVKAPPHWSFQPIRNPPVPEVNGTQWPRGSIDHFILAQLERQGIRPAPPADRRTLLRRATFDLTGLPPTPEEVDAFLADPAPDAFKKVVERLLDSPRYGEHWGRHWLDLVRYADTAGETADYPVPLAWRYRNYVINAFNADKPYDTFVREQIAGDILAAEGPREHYAESVTATGYLALSRRFGFDSENYHHLTIQDTIDTLGQSLLGLSLGCARCHDHKYDPVSQVDYYALYGIFDSSRYAFPGSEQKTRSRALAPLLPPVESRAQWRTFDARVAALADRLTRHQLPVSAAVLDSLDELDGDFEMQAVANGGSKGVLVPPWICDGPVAVTRDAQSPFKNLHGRGQVGGQVPAGTHSYIIAQALHPRRTPAQCPVLHVNLDFRVGTNDAAAAGSHRFWLGAQGSAPAVEILLTSESASIRSGTTTKSLRRLRPDRWHNLQFTLDLQARTVSGRIGVPEDVVTFADEPFASGWSGVIDYVALDSSGPGDARRPGLYVDNLGVQESPVPPVSTSPPAIASLADGPDPAAVTEQLHRLVGMDGDLELQTDGKPPAGPWGPGPKSTVTVSADAQSPYQNVFGPGRLGLRLPNNGNYEGFGQTLPTPWKAGPTGSLTAGFDFRCTTDAAGGDGSWRFYLGHGPGTSKAMELFINAHGFFQGGADAHALVRPMHLGEWYQVRLTLDLKARTYTGSIAHPAETVGFAGKLAGDWDGIIDYTFIDSYGHLPGVRPGLDADNLSVGDRPLPALDAPPVKVAVGERETRRAEAARLHRQLAEIKAADEKLNGELNTLLAGGPFDLAYAVTEGTPHNARLQQRGEPDRPGGEVPRGFLQALGGGPLPAATTGSGRLELAGWLTRPDHPLTARVMVNRIWQHHFGRGLVRTPNDFGLRGQPPTQPELLDHLATQFIKGGWSIKEMHRLILLSATYQTSVLDDPNSPAAEHFGSFVRRRLSAEEIRDSLLQISGELDVKPGEGHPFPGPIDWYYTQHAPFNADYDHSKRSVYLMTQRIRRHPFLALFDGADPNSSTAERRVTTVPTQALYFLNDPFVHAQSEKLTARLQRMAPDEARRLTAAYRLTLGRSPTADERAEAAGFFASYRAGVTGVKSANPETAALAAYARALFSSNEFLHVE